MRILYLTAPFGDFLADSIFHGLRTLYGASVVDYPRSDAMYKDWRAEASQQVHGRGFTLYGLLDEVPVDRYDVFTKVKLGYYDLVIFSSIHRQFGYFVQLLPLLKRHSTIVIDGEDDGALYPYRGNYWRNSAHRFLPRAHTRFPYFKREFNLDTLRYRWFKVVPRGICTWISKPRGIYPISFSIPAEKIVDSPPIKIKDFPAHVVDPEVATAIGASINYAFEDEASYYADLKASRYGISPRRAGWDAIRHYEVAANGAVLCVRNLSSKPPNSAPHGLNSTNAIDYSSWNQLRRRLATIRAEEYQALQAATISWARSNTTEVRAREMLDVWRASVQNSPG